MVHGERKGQVEVGKYGLGIRGLRAAIVMKNRTRGWAWDEHLWLVRVECGVYSGWREMMTGELERCGDSSEWVNNPVQLPPGPGSDPGPGTLDCEPGPVTRSPVCLLKRAPDGDYRRSKACDDFWSQISPHELYWNPDLRWTLNQ